MEFKNRKEITSETASENGKASGRARREKKNMREIAQMFLDMPCTISENIEELLKLSKHLGVKLDIQGAILLAQIHKAIVQKDTKAAEFVRDTAGQKPTDKVDMEGKLTYTNLLDKAIGKEEM